MPLLQRLTLSMLKFGLRENKVSNSDYASIEPLSGLEQKYIKASLAKAFVSKEIVTAVVIDWQGRIEIKTNVGFILEY
jgi:hypothetical protein